MQRAPLIAWRVILVALVLGLAAAAGLQAAAASMRDTATDVALRLNPNDAVALVASGDRNLQSGDVGFDPVALAATAERALRLAPLSPGALRQIGLAADAANDHDRARNMMLISMRVSRRDLFTHVWLIEDRVAAGDVAGALDQYDLALSTNDQAGDILFPVLSAALENPQIRSSFLPLIGKDRPWMASFLGYAITASARPQDVAELVIARGGMPSGANYDILETQLLTALVAKGQYVAAHRYGLSLRGARARALADAGFSEESLNPALVPLTWQLADQAEVRARRDDEGRIAVLAESNVRSIAARRILFLRPGAYRFAQTVSPLPQTEPAPLAWQVSCLPAAASDPIWEQSVPASTTKKRYSWFLTIPQQCEAQQLSLTIAGTDSQSESGVSVGPVVLQPVASQ